MALGLLLAGCTTTRPTEGVPVGPPIPTGPVAGLDRVIGRDARALQILFGEPDLDVREGRARKLQYAGPICVLDAYLYGADEGREPTVRYIDARTTAGDDFDRASCIAALTRRREAR